MGKTVLIAEQSEIIRKGLAQVLEGLQMVGSILEASCLAGLGSSIDRFRPDILIVNPLAIEGETADFLRQEKKDGLKVAAVVYSLFNDDLRDIFDEVIEIGDTAAKIKKKVKRLVDSGQVRETNDEILSVREKDVVRLLARGLSNKEISDQLFISPHTVITHRRNITRKLNIRSVAGLIVYAIINDIVTVEEMQE